MRFLNEVIHDLTLPAEDEMTYSVNTSFPYVFNGGSTKLTTGETRMDPRLKHSGVTIWE
jgi:hypothetical protein